MVIAEGLEAKIEPEEGLLRRADGDVEARKPSLMVLSTRWRIVLEDMTADLKLLVCGALKSAGVGFPHRSQLQQMSSILLLVHSWS